jgi:hypothetical protein
VCRTQGEGFVNHENVWERSDGACSSSHFLYRFRHTPKERYTAEFPEFINKTVVSTLPGFSCSELILGQFIYGDSVGRHLYDDYCHYLGMKGERRAFPDEKEPVIYWEGTICTEPALNFKVMHLHNYGTSL